MQKFESQSGLTRAMCSPLAVLQHISWALRTNLARICAEWGNSASSDAKLRCAVCYLKTIRFLQRFVVKVIPQIVITDSTQQAVKAGCQNEASGRRAPTRLHTRWVNLLPITCPTYTFHLMRFQASALNKAK